MNTGENIGKEDRGRKNCVFKGGISLFVDNGMMARCETRVWVSKSGEREGSVVDMNNRIEQGPDQDEGECVILPRIHEFCEAADNVL